MPDQSQFSRKASLRKQILAARSELSDRDTRSEAICNRWIQSDLHRRTGSILCYVNVRSEVSTRGLIEACWQAEQRVAVPYCVGQELALTWITSWDELEPGRFGILEPLDEFRNDPSRCPCQDELDVVFVPGVAFDRQGGRLGHGQGFYDRLLASLPKRTTLVGIAFDCQIVAEVPTEPHDIPMDFILTESAWHACQEST